jgi:hypothetical protein
MHKLPSSTGVDGLWAGRPETRCYGVLMTTPELPASSPIITYPRDAILESVDVCAALRVSQEIVDKMDLPCFYAGRRPRYIWGMVLDALAERAKPAAGTPAISIRSRRPKRAGNGG